MKYSIIACILLFAIGCTDKKASISDQIVKISRNKIILDDGNEISLASTDSSKVVYLVRHAEKDTSIAKNPPLTEVGEQRAEKLAEILKGTRVDEIYSTLYTRTLFTAEPITQSKGLSIQPYLGDQLGDLVDKIKKSSSKRFLVIGHSNSTAKVANLLSNKSCDSIDEKVYDDLFIVQYTEENQELLRLKY